MARNPKLHETYFKPGHSKVGGRKKGTLNVSTHVKRALQAKLTLPNKKGEKETKTVLDWIIVNSLYKAIKKGDWHLIESAYKMLEEKPEKHNIEISNNVSVETTDSRPDEILGELKDLANAITASSDNKSKGKD